jgi:hypothetical protein
MMLAAQALLSSLHVRVCSFFGHRWQPTISPVLRDNKELLQQLNQHTLD